MTTPVQSATARERNLPNLSRTLGRKESASSAPAVENDQRRWLESYKAKLVKSQAKKNGSAGSGLPRATRSVLDDPQPEFYLRNENRNFETFGCYCPDHHTRPRLEMRWKDGAQEWQISCVEPNCRFSRTETFPSKYTALRVWNLAARLTR